MTLDAIAKGGVDGTWSGLERPREASDDYLSGV